MNDDQLLRYSRQIMLPGFDIEGQQRLLAAKVLIVGLGGLGCPVAMYLAAAGVGELHLADFDQVELSNLQRQIAHNTHDIGLSKVASAAETIGALNPDTRVQCINKELVGEALQHHVAQVDLVIDCSDNFSTRFAINRCCVASETPLVSAAAIRGEGQCIVFDAGNKHSPCYRCLYQDADGHDDDSLSCSESGVLSPLVGILGSIQALEAIKLLANYGETQLGRLSVFDARTMDWRKLTVARDPQCPVCSQQAG